MIRKTFNQVFVDYDESVIYIAFPDFPAMFSIFPQAIKFDCLFLANFQVSTNM